MHCIGKRGNKVSNAKGYSGSYSALSQGVEYASGRLALKKPPWLDPRQEIKEVLLEKILFLNVS